MDISYLGKGNFKIRAKTGSVLTEDNRLSITHKSGGDDFVINQSGEYEVEGISVFGYKAEENIVYVVQFEDKSVAYPGNLSKALTENHHSLENITW
jgi:hypothetical protein